MNVLSLFDGISCGQLALERSAIKVENYYASEIEKWPILITNRHFPNTIQLGDINNISYRDGILSNTKDKYETKIDLLIGGSPCQSFSFNGKREGFEGKSGLFYQYLRLLQEIKPKYFLLENVVMKKEWKNQISNLLGVEPIFINSSLVSAQNRPRLYWTNIPNVSQPNDKNILVKDILETGVGKEFAISEKILYNEMNGKWTSRRKIINPMGKSECLQASRLSHKVKENGFHRRFTPIEYERLQTLPDNWTDVVNENGKRISKTPRYRALGNCWTVDVVAHIFSNIKES